jgi:hypothetical protein
MVGYQSGLVARDAPAVAVMHELAAQYRAMAIGASWSSWNIVVMR